MRVLFITPFNLFPPYWGGGTRTHNLLKHLSRKHEIFLVYPSFKQFKNKDPEIYRKELANLGIRLFEISTPVGRIQYINPLIVLKCLSLILKENIDLIICDYPWSGFYTLALHFLTGKRFIFIEHNIEYLIKWQIGAKYVNFMKILERILSRRASAITTVCGEDKEKLSKFDSVYQKTFVFENGFDEQIFYPNGIYNPETRSKLNIGNSPFILFFGKLDYPPNKEAVYKIRWDILPKVLEKIPDSKFVIVGGGYKFNLEHNSLIFTGLVENIERYINAADVVIAPLLKGGGTKIKILEAVACGKTVITTSKGAEGLINDFTRPFLRIADDWETFSDHIVECLNDDEPPHLRKEFIEKYSWRRVYEKMDKILENMTKIKD